MPYTTAKLIRNKQSTLISALQSDDLRGNKFREYDRSEPFTDWADANPRACLRMFYIEDLATYESPLISDGQLEQVQTNFRIQVAYPKDARYSKSLKSSRADAMDLIESDRKDIDTAIGLLGSADYVSGQNSAIALSKDVEELENVWILSFDLDVIYYLNVGLDLTACVAAITPSAAVSAACVLGYPLVAAIAASASITAACTFDAAAAYTLGTLTPSQVATITSMPTPTFMWRGGDASGATELVAGADNLTDSATPTKEVVSAALGGALTTEFTAGSTDAVTAASGTVADVGAGTVSGIVIYERISVSNNRNVIGKRTGAAGNSGYEVLLNTSGFVNFNVDTDLGASGRSVASDHGTGNAETVGFKRSAADNETGVWSRLGASTATSPTGTMTNAQPFSMGKGGLFAADGCRVAVAILWIGSDGDGFGETERLALAQALGLEA